MGDEADVEVPQVHYEGGRAQRGEVREIGLHDERQVLIYRGYRINNSC